MLVELKLCDGRKTRWTHKDKQQCLFFFCSHKKQAGRLNEESLSPMQAHRGRETGSQHGGQANADRTLHCSLDSELHWNLNWPFDGSGKGGEGDENGICPSFLAFIISLFAPCLFMSHNLFPSLAVLLEKTLFCC